MKIFSSLVAAFVFVTILSACTSKVDQTTSQLSSPSSTSSATTRASNLTSSTTSETNLNIELFTIDELFNQGGGGCGMTLWKPEDGLRPAGYLFYNRLAQNADDEFTLMKINDEFVHFRRTTAAGQAFYGQQPSQTFVSQDETIQLQVDVIPGQPGEIESVAVEGTLQLQHRQQTIEIPVQGDAGC